MTTPRNIRGARLTAGTLARFAGGLTWPSVLSLDGERTRGWWRMALAEAEERRMLAWSRGKGRWILTPAGRAATRGVS